MSEKEVEPEKCELEAEETNDIAVSKLSWDPSPTPEEDITWNVPDSIPVMHQQTAITITSTQKMVGNKNSSVTTNSKDENNIGELAPCERSDDNDNQVLAGDNHVDNPENQPIINEILSTQTNDLNVETFRPADDPPGEDSGDIDLMSKQKQEINDQGDHSNNAQTEQLIDNIAKSSLKEPASDQLVDKTAEQDLGVKDETCTSKPADEVDAGGSPTQQPATTDLSKEDVKIYISSVSSNRELKKKQQRILSIMDSKSIPYVTVDIAIEAELRTKMRELSNVPNALPPRIFKGDHYLGDYDDFDEAVECETLKEFLLLG